MKVILNSHHEYRKADYPTVEEQLDLLWHAMDECRAEKIEPWYSIIKDVKERYPKEPDGRQCTSSCRL